MITINRLREFTAEIKAVINNISIAELVMDDSEFLKVLESVKPTDNFIFIAVVPQYPLEGSDDSYKWNNQLQFFILKKLANKDTTKDLYYSLLNDTQIATNEFIKTIITNNIGENGTICGVSNEMKSGSLIVKPVWNKAQCHGWTIEVDLLSEA